MNESQRDKHEYPSDVVLQINQEDRKSYLVAAKTINEFASETIVIVQHEYGIYGGSSGRMLLELLNALECPVITTFHTVIANPNDEMRNVTEQIIVRSDRLVVLTDSSLDLLTSQYPEAKEKSVRIMHGIHPLLYELPSKKKLQFGLENRKVLLTFGLLSRNKGIEYIISALPKVIKEIPDILYLVIGATHPAVVRWEGESYRLELEKLVKDLSLGDYVTFIDEFLPLSDLLEYIQAADIYLATSLDPEQAVSGTLSYALGAGRAVIATNFAQAKEIVTPEVGRIVPIRDSRAVSDTLLELFHDPEQLLEMNNAAYSQTRSMLWSNTADEYATCLSEVANEHDTIFDKLPKLNWSHLEEMTDTFGMFQFSIGTDPDYISGYTLDDNSRALQVVQAAFEMDLLDEAGYERLSIIYLGVIDACLSETPSVNYISASSRRPTKQNLVENLDDSMARAYYALQTAICSSSAIINTRASVIISKLSTSKSSLMHIHTTAQHLLGAAFALDHGDDLIRGYVDSLARILIDAYRENTTDEWKWFDTTMTYASGQLCVSLLEAARVTGSKEYRNVGLESLEFLMQRCFMGEIYVPIGQDGWHSRDGTRALFDQQPEDVLSMIQALESAYRLTHDAQYVKRAEKVFSWFMGNNLIGQRVYDDKSGGAHDGLMPSGVNVNEGAESTISYLGARLIIERLRNKD